MTDAGALARTGLRLPRRDARRHRLHRATRSILLGATFLLGALARAEPIADPCTDRGTVVLILTGPHELRQCQDDHTLRVWRVALGSGGVDKTTEGDRKTPLGTYPLGEPRPSRSFGTFIPVGYPTPEQRRAGYTGSAIGIHGPLREFRDRGVINIATDWTLGCIAVGSDPIIDELALWVRTNHVKRVVIL